MNKIIYNKRPHNIIGLKRNTPNAQHPVKWATLDRVLRFKSLLNGTFGTWGQFWMHSLWGKNVFWAEFGWGKVTLFFKKVYFSHPEKAKLGDYLSSKTHFRLFFPAFCADLVRFRQNNGCRASFREAEYWLSVTYFLDSI